MEPGVRDYPEIPEVVTLSVAPEEHRHQFGTGENIKKVLKDFLTRCSHMIPVGPF